MHTDPGLSAQMIDALDDISRSVSAVKSLAITPDGRRVIAGLTNGALVIWDLAGGGQVYRLEGHQQAVDNVAIAPNGRMAISACVEDSTLRVWDVNSGQEKYRIEGAAGAVALTPDGRLALSGALDNSLQLWDITRQRQLLNLPGIRPRTSTLAFTPDGHLAISGSQGKNLYLWNLAEGRAAGRLAGSESAPTALALTPDGKLAVSGSRDGKIWVWNVPENRLLYPPLEHPGRISSLAITSDGRLAVSGSSDWTLRVWDLVGGTELRSLVGHMGAINVVAITPDGRLAVSSSEDSTLRVWDIAEGRETHQLTTINQREFDRLLRLGMESPAAGLYRRLLQKSADIAGRLEIEIRHPGQATPRSPGINPRNVARSADRIADAIYSTSPFEESAEPPQPRFFNTFFTPSADSQFIQPDQPLVYDHVYDLVVELHPQQRGLGLELVPVPFEVLPEEVREDWEAGQSLPLTVWVASRDFQVWEPQQRSLSLSWEGPSEPLRFRLRPLRQEGQAKIQVELFFKGNLLQSRQVTAEIVPAQGIPLPDDQQPAQSARLTFNASLQLTKEDLQDFPERVITINTERNLQDDSLNFRILDRSRGDTQPRFIETRLQSNALQNLVGNIRLHLKDLVKGANIQGSPVEGYEWILDGDEGRLATHLPRLAEVGHSLYTAIFPAGQPLPTLDPGTAVQINPVLGLVTIPWGLLYERDISYRPGRTRLCPSYKTHPPNDCPSAADREVVCPYAFWGYRYVIEQIPAWLSTEIPTLPSLVRRVNNSTPLNLNLNVWRDFSYWQDHRNKLDSTHAVRLQVAEVLDQMEAIWQQNGSELDLVYFYCHGGVDQTLGPYLELSDDRFGNNILSSIGATWPRNPLVLLNACATGDYTPESYVSLIATFRQIGASGLVGTESLVPEMFAEAFMAELLPRWFRGERLGQAMLSVRRKFLKENLNPLGLLYSLYAPNEISLAHPVLSPA